MLPNTASAFAKTATDFSVLSPLSRQPRHVLLATDSLDPSGVGEHIVGEGRLVLTVARFTGQKRHATLLKALPARSAPPRQSATVKPVFSFPLITPLFLPPPWHAC